MYSGILNIIFCFFAIFFAVHTHHYVQTESDLCEHLWSIFISPPFTESLWVKFLLNIDSAFTISLTGIRSLSFHT